MTESDLNDYRESAVEFSPAMLAELAQGAEECAQTDEDGDACRWCGKITDGEYGNYCGPLCRSADAADNDMADDR